MIFLQLTFNLKINKQTKEQKLDFPLKSFDQVFSQYLQESRKQHTANSWAPAGTPCWNESV